MVHLVAVGLSGRETTRGKARSCARRSRCAGAPQASDARWLTPERVRARTGVWGARRHPDAGQRAGRSVSRRPGPWPTQRHRPAPGSTRGRASGATETSADGVRLVLDRGEIRAGGGSSRPATPRRSSSRCSAGSRCTHLRDDDAAALRELAAQVGLGDVMWWDTENPYHYARWTPRRPPALRRSRSARQLSAPGVTRAARVARLVADLGGLYPALTRRRAGIRVGGTVRDDAGRAAVYRRAPPLSEAPLRARLRRQRHDVRIPRRAGARARRAGPSRPGGRPVCIQSDAACGARADPVRRARLQSRRAGGTEVPPDQLLHNRDSNV